MEKIKMKNDEIKQLIKTIIANGSGIVYDDDGSGCSDAGYFEPETLQEMLDDGIFDDAVIVPFDKLAAQTAFKKICSFDDDTEWIQIAFNVSETYHQIAWIWDI